MALIDSFYRPVIPNKLSSRAERDEKICSKGTDRRGVEGPRRIVLLKTDSGSFHDGLSQEQHRSSPIFRQVLPAWIHLLDERDLFLTMPSFNLLFTCDGFENIVKSLVVNQTDALVGFRESFNLECFVLKDPCVQMACDACVQGTGHAGHDVDPVLVLSLQAH